MKRTLRISLLLLALAGCQLPAERVPLKPLVEGTPPQTYADLLGRSRVLASGATEAFFMNGWTDLEEYARNMELTARFLTRATEVPEAHKATLAARAGELEKQAQQLKEAARNQNEKQATEILQRINLTVRELRVEK